MMRLQLLFYFSKHESRDLWVHAIGAMRASRKRVQERSSAAAPPPKRATTPSTRLAAGGGSGANFCNATARRLQRTRDTAKRLQGDPAAIAFRSWIFHQWASGVLNNKQTCEVSYLTTAAGARGVSDLAVNPASKGDNFARKVKHAFNTALMLRDVYYLWVPLYDKSIGTRTWTKLPIILPHEILQKLDRDNPKLFRPCR